MNTSISRPASFTMPTAARISVASGMTFIGLLATLHILKPDLDPSWRPISEYALGDFGWMMTIAFLAWGLSAFGLIVALRTHVRSRLGKIGFGLLLIGGLGPVLAGLFPTDPVTTPINALTTSGTIHSFGAGIIDGILLGGTLLTWSLVRKNERWLPERRRLVLAMIVGWIAFFVLTVSMGVLMSQHGPQLSPDIQTGWQARFLVIVYVAWIVNAAWSVVRVESRLAHL